MNPFKYYYRVKKLIPRWLQVKARRGMAYAARRVRRDKWPIDRRSSAQPPLFAGWPNGKGFALVLRHDIESLNGLGNCANILELERAHGLRSGFFFVPEDYVVEEEMRQTIKAAGCEVGVHGLRHDGKLYLSRKLFRQQACRINEYLRDWQAVGFASPSSHHRLKWLHELDILYDSSCFDTDPFEPQPDGIRTIFPMEIHTPGQSRSFIELPYTLPQDFTLFVILQETTTEIWRKKLDWIAKKGGMAMIVTHPDYMVFPGASPRRFSYPSHLYEDLLAYVEKTHAGAYWGALPHQVAEFWRTLSTTGANEACMTSERPAQKNGGAC
jgi:peptidoglycan/xylan/chitin deacetylase (PgdA/CDA1 family)